MITRNVGRRCACGVRLSWPTATSCDSCQNSGRWERLYAAEDDRQRRECDRQVVDQLADRAKVDRDVQALLSRRVDQAAPERPVTVARGHADPDAVWRQMQAAASRRDWPEHRRLQMQLMTLQDARR